MLDTQTTSFVLPDLVSLVPFPWSTSPYYEKAGAESAAWIDSFNVFKDSKRAFFIQSRFELLCSYVYPYTQYEEFRTCCDLINLTFVVDEVSDLQSGEGASKTAETFLAALSGKKDDGSLLATITKQFRERFVKGAAPRCQERFLVHCANYMNAVAREADLRANGRVLDLGSYMSLRRDNSGIQPFFGLFEYVHGIDLPNKVFDDPVFQRVYWAGCDLVGISNDLYSYNIEQAKGLEGNNMMTILMEDKGISLQEASDYIGEEFKRILNQLIEDIEALPSFGPTVDDAVQKYIYSIKHWVIGNLIWSFESQRYFGTEHLEIKRTLVVNVRPREVEAEAEDEE